MAAEISILANGIRIVSDRMDGVETASFGMFVGVGTRDEAAAANGVAHLLEHMVFKGTARRNARAIAEEIEQVGGAMNAYTGRETTAYYARVMAEHMGLAVDLIGDILSNSLFDPAELDRERDVILQEIGQALDTPEDLVFDRFQETAFPGQGLGRPVLGTAEIVKSVPRDAVMGFLRRTYRPGRMVAAASGKVDHDAFCRLVERGFGAWTPEPAPEPAPESAPESDRARYAGGERRDTREGEQVHLVLGFEGPATADPDFYPAWVASHLLGGGMSSRLFQEIREIRGLVYAIYTYLASYRDGGVFGLYAGTAPDKVDEVLSVTAAELLAALDGAGPDELARVKAQLKAGILMGLESSFNRAEHLAGQLLTYGRLVPVDEIAASIDAVDNAAMNRVLGRILGSAPTLAALGPLAPFMDLAAFRGRLSPAR